MGKLLWKPGTLIAPVPPVLVTCGTLEKPNVLTVAWTGICNTSPAMTYISVRPERYSHGIILQSKEFVINLTTAAMVRAVDFCGVRSGRDGDKLTQAGLTAVPAGHVAPPLLQESPLSLECRVRQVLELGSHHMFLADIIAVDVDDQYVDKAGKLRLDRCGLLAFAHGDYFELGKQLGTFGFSVRKKSTSKRKAGPYQRSKNAKNGR